MLPILAQSILHYLKTPSPKWVNLLLGAGVIYCIYLHQQVLGV